ncbi:hypothetical protein PsorP6_009908 [Peronosclerospora sorghi]|uniref:Uncharacterized protein n=1 Tax=Peronosclerospora sorghi TaxID=230839 RepID=A0ACC0W010_9STRA|nr:hypothetical protein PsorP6_009908 [Peronosclerospora sorghi]
MDELVGMTKLCIGKCRSAMFEIDPTKYLFTGMETIAKAGIEHQQHRVLESNAARKMMSSVHAHGQDTCSKDPDECMRAVVWTGKSVKLEQVPKPKIMEASDVVVKVTACSLSPYFATDVSGSASELENDRVLGSEGVGVVDIVACNCTNASLGVQKTSEGWDPAAVLGSTRMLGHVPGGQAEYVRVPYADINFFKLSSGVSDDKALLGVNTTVTALHAVNTAEVKENDYVVIWGLDTIGLHAAHWCKLRGAKSTRS